MIGILDSSIPAGEDGAVVRIRVQTGGPVGEDRRYLERPADRALPDAMREGALCALFAPRQEGKSSLMLRTADRLAVDGVRCVVVDVGLLVAATATEEDLFQFLTDEIASQTGEVTEVVGGKTPSTRFIAWLTGVASRSETRIAIFIDEIHLMLEAPRLSDALLQALRVLHEGRARSAALNRVSYCLAGVARPRDLVSDERMNPFAIGTVIRLEDFTLEELMPLRADFAAAKLPEELVDHIFRWTHGHPFMTSMLVRELAATPRPGTSSLKEHVDAIVETSLLSEAYATENYLADARLLFDTSKRFGSADLGRAVEIYRRLVRGEVVREEDAGASAVVLVLAGIAAGRTEEGVRLLRPRNRITRELFGEDWIDRMEVTRYLDGPLQNWLCLERAPHALLSGELLDAAIAVAKRASEVTQAQRAFLLASIDARQAAVVGEQTHAAQKARALVEHDLLSERVHHATAVKRYRIYQLALMISLVAIMAILMYRLVHSAGETEELRRQVRDQSELVSSLGAAAEVQRATIDQREKDLDAAQTRANRAKQEADEIEQQLQNATSDREKRKREAGMARAQARRLQQDVDHATHDLEAAKRAARAADKRARDAKKSLDVARAATEALTAELDGRRAIEQNLTSERNRSMALAADLEKVRGDLDKAREALEKTRGEVETMRREFHTHRVKAAPCALEQAPSKTTSKQGDPNASGDTVPNLSAPSGADAEQ